MLKSFIKIAWRNCWKHKLFSFINIFGLALSLAVCMLILVQVKEDLGYDTFHPNAGRTYRVLSDIAENKNGNKYTLASTPLPLSAELARQTGIVEASVQIYPALKGKAAGNEKELHINGAFTDPSFFTVFGFKLSAGDARTALSAPNGIVLSRETAQRFFNEVDPIGKMLIFKDLGLFQVTGVMEPPPGKSHLQFDAYASSFIAGPLQQPGALAQQKNNWNTLNEAYTYVLLKKGVGLPQLNALLTRLSSTPSLRSDEGSVRFTPQALSRITPGSDGIYNEIGRGTVWAKLLTIIGIGFILLLAACFNYTNLTIARALTRAKEVGIRKVSGATRAHVFLQYVVESVMIALLALALACLLLVQFKPGFHFTPVLLVVVVFFTIVTGSLAGAFPAWILSAFKPVHVLKTVLTQKLFGSLSLRKGLMVFQFSLSLLVLIFLSAYYRQFSYMETLNPGFYSQNILTVPAPTKAAIFSNEITRISGVERLSATSETFGMRGSGSVLVYLNKPVEGQGISTNFYFTDAGMIPLHRLKLVAGGNFPATGEGDKEQYVILNEKAVQVLNFKSAVNAVGKTVWLNDSTAVEIKGIIRDFNDAGVARQITPLVLRSKAGEYNYLNIEVNATDREQVVKKVAAAWKNLHPQVPFTYEWLDKKIANREDQSDMYATLGSLAVITISIAALGLLGLVIYTVETRQKEISIRKVVGAATSQLLFLLSKGFLKMLVVSGLIAMPAGYICSFIFLQNFPSRVPFGIGTLLASFLFLLAIGLVTILSSTYRAATANPVKNLRTE